MAELDIDSIKWQLEQKGWVVLRQCELDTILANAHTWQTSMLTAHNDIRILRRKNRMLTLRHDRAAKIIGKYQRVVDADLTHVKAIKEAEDLGAKQRRFSTDSITKLLAELKAIPTLFASSETTGEECKSK